MPPFDPRVSAGRCLSHKGRDGPNLRPLAGLLVCLPLLLAAAPQPAVAPPPTAAPAHPPRTERVERVPPDRAMAILGQTVYSPSGKAIGRLIDILVDAAGAPQAAVIDFGGFMGVGSRKIAVHWSTLHFAPSAPKHQITLDLTVNQIKAAPEYRNNNKPAPVVVRASAPPADTSASTPVPPAAPPAQKPPVRE